MLYRNTLVYKERNLVSSKIFEKQNDHYIWSGEVPLLLAEMESIATYDQMMHRFWKPPSSFYRTFLDELEARKIQDQKIQNRKTQES